MRHMLLTGKRNRYENRDCTLAAPRGGKAPFWLFQRMKKPAREIVIAIVSEYGPQEMVKRISDPFWFQAVVLKKSGDVFTEYLQAVIVDAFNAYTLFFVPVSFFSSASVLLKYSGSNLSTSHLRPAV